MNRTKNRTIRLALWILAAFVCLLPAGCAGDPEPYGSYNRYSKDVIGSFNTVITLIGYCEDEAEFNQYARQAEARFTELYHLYDIYNPYDGLNNLYAVNEAAGGAAVHVQQELIDLLLYCRDAADTYGNSVDITAGAMLAQWSDYREAGRADPESAELPPMEDLDSAYTLRGWDNVAIDETAGTVRLKQSGMRLDAGAVAKGFATEIVAGELVDAGWESFLISNGASSIVLHGRPYQDGKETWSIGLQNPSALLPASDEDAATEEPYVAIARLNDRAIGNSGDYQNYYTVDGVHYHHLIDPETRMPADHFRGVSVFAPDCGQADYLSSLLFLLPYDEGRALIDTLPDIDAAWIFPDGRMETTPGAADLLSESSSGS